MPNLGVDKIASSSTSTHHALRSSGENCYHVCINTSPGGVPCVARGGAKSGRKRDGSSGGDTGKENNKKKSGKDGSCRKKLEYLTSKKSSKSNKPPLSYASLISLAICSTPQRMMTLSGIYRWIENTFPFYRTPEAKAWKVCTGCVFTCSVCWFRCLCVKRCVWLFCV